MRYSVNYCGACFVGDDEGVNTHYFSNLRDALELLESVINLGVDEYAYLKDEEYQCSMYWDAKTREFYWEA